MWAFDHRQRHSYANRQSQLLNSVKGFHMLFAQSDGSSFFSLILVLAFFLYGMNRAVKMIGGNPTARSAAVKGASHLISRLFK